MAIPTYTKSGTKATTAATLDQHVFGVEVSSHELLKAAYVAHHANKRDNLAVTKTRGLVRGGGKKPWKQKGTGRARFGSTRNPIWRGGGIVFGPTGNENYTKQLNTKAKRLALRQALSLAAQENTIIVVDSFESKLGKTTDASKFLQKIKATGRTLVVVAQKEDLVERALRNLVDVHLATAQYLNTADILDADTIVVDKNALVTITNWLKEEA